MSSSVTERILVSDETKESTEWDRVLSRVAVQEEFKTKNVPLCKALSSFLPGDMWFVNHGNSASKLLPLASDSISKSKNIADRVTNKRVLMILGDALGLEEELERDVVLALLYVYKMRVQSNGTRPTDYAKDFAESVYTCLLESSDAVKNVNANGATVGLVSAPSLDELDAAFDWFSAEPAVGYEVFFCGHGFPGGHFALGDGPHSAATLYQKLIDGLSERNHYPNIYMFFNCCYADECVVNVCFKASVLFNADYDCRVNLRMKISSALTSLVVGNLSPRQLEMWGVIDSGTYTNAQIAAALSEFRGGEEDAILLRAASAMRQVRADPDDTDPLPLMYADLSLEEDPRDDEPNGAAKHLATDGPPRREQPRTVAEPNVKPSSASGEPTEQPSPDTRARHEVDACLAWAMRDLPYGVPLRRNDGGIVRPCPLGVGLMPAAGALIALLHGSDAVNTSDDFNKWVSQVRAAYTSDGETEGTQRVTTRRLVVTRAGNLQPLVSKFDRNWANDWRNTYRPLVSPFRVGCADATVISLPIGGDKVAIMLVDGGRHSDAKRWWSAIGALCAVDTLVLTHCDFDHAGGIRELARSTDAIAKLGLSQMWVTALGLKRARGQYAYVESILKVPKFKKVAREPLRKDELSLAAKGSENVEIHILNPSPAQVDELKTKFRTKLATAPIDPNDASIAMLVLWSPPGTTPKTSPTNAVVSMVLTGDAFMKDVLAGLREVTDAHVHVRAIVRDVDQPAHFHVTLLDMPHHGSTKGTTVDDLNAIKADHYVFQSDGGRRYNTTMCGQTLTSARARNPKGKMWLTFDKFVNDKVKLHEGCEVLGKKDACHLIYL